MQVPGINDAFVYCYRDILHIAVGKTSSTLIVVFAAFGIMSFLIDFHHTVDATKQSLKFGGGGCVHAMRLADGAISDQG